MGSRTRKGKRPRRRMRRGCGPRKQTKRTAKASLKRSKTKPRKRLTINKRYVAVIRTPRRGDTYWEVRDARRKAIDSLHAKRQRKEDFGRARDKAEELARLRAVAAELGALGMSAPPSENYWKVRAARREAIAELRRRVRNACRVEARYTYTEASISTASRTPNSSQTLSWARPQPAFEADNSYNYQLSSQPFYIYHTRTCRCSPA